MLKNAVFFAGAALALALLAPQYLSGLSAPDAPPRPAAAPTPPVAPAAAPAARSDSFGEKSIAPDANGQYHVDGLIGGEYVHMMVDTGATYVSIPEDLAERIGLDLSKGQKGSVRTANGVAPVTLTVLPSVDLGTIYMKDVPVVVGDRRLSPMILLGESFLQRLTSVEQRNGVLILKQ